MKPHPGRKGKDRVLLGLAVSALSLREGQTRTSTEIAAFCDCHRWNIEKIYRQALVKIRLAVGLQPDGTERAHTYNSTIIERSHQCSRR